MSIGVLLALLLCNPPMSSVLPQDPVAACNNRARQITTRGGNYSTGATQCAAFTLTVLGQSFSTPSACDYGRREQSDDCFDCTGPPLEGTHCKGRGFEVNVKIYSVGGDNPCPTFPASLPETLQEAAAIVQCKELPLISDKTTWCASVIDCATGMDISDSDHGTVRTQADGDDVLVWHGDPSEMLPGPVPDPALLALQGIPTAPLSELPSALSGAIAGLGELQGLGNVVANIELHFPRASELGVINTYDVRGTIARDGRFKLHHIPPTIRVDAQPPAGQVSEGGADSPSGINELVFDGATFFWGVEGARYYHAHAATSPTQRATRGTRAAFLRGLLELVDDPFRTARLEGAGYAIDGPNAEGLVVVVESYLDIESPVRGTTTYWIDTNLEPPRPVRIEVRDDAGTLRTLREFASYRSLGEGVWRPTETEVTRFGPDGNPWLIARTNLSAGTVLSAQDLEAAIATPFLGTGKWLIHL